MPEKIRSSAYLFGHYYYTYIDHMSDQVVYSCKKKRRKKKTRKISQKVVIIIRCERI